MATFNKTLKLLATKLGLGNEDKVIKYLTHSTLFLWSLRNILK